MRGRMTNAETQLDKFKKAARDLESDEDEAAFDRALGKIAKAEPAKDVPEPPKKPKG